MLLVLVAALLLAAQARKLPFPDNADNDPDFNKNVSQIIVERGYPCEEHVVVTQDGYVLNIQRINTAPGNNTGVAYLQHGLIDSSITWVIGSTNSSKDLAFILADAGYDVWLGNSRGNTYAQTNIYLNPDEEQFWLFSYDEFVKFDIPAKVDYILGVTGVNKLFYIGHSEGSNIGLATFSTNATLANKIQLFVALAPAAFLGHALPKPIHDLVLVLKPQEIYDLFGTKSFLNKAENALWRDVVPPACQAAESVCADLLCYFVGCESNQNVNQTRLPTIFNHYPAGTSVMNMIHYIQMVQNDTFSYYDFGPTGNEQHYGTPTAPAYPLQNLDVATAIFYGSHDELADPTDVQKLISILPQSKVVFKEEITGYGHGDFVWGLDAETKVYSTVLSLLSQYK